MELWGINFAPIINDVIHWAVLAIIPVLVSFAFREYRKLAPKFDAWLTARVSTQQRALLESLASTAVRAVEQICAREDVKDAAQAKLKAACEYVDENLKSHGVTGVTLEQIIPVVEAAVFSELKQPAAAATPAPAPASSRITKQLG